MTPTQQVQLEEIIIAHIRHSFDSIKVQTDKAGKDIRAYFFGLVDDFFAMTDTIITVQDMADYGDDCTLLDAIWSGEGTLYEGEYLPVDAASADWLDRQSLLYKTIYQLANSTDDYDVYNQVRADVEACLIRALKRCDDDGVFGAQDNHGILLFAFYKDDYDGNGAGSLLHRSAQALNDGASVRQIIA